jgi:NADH:ubiquinone oxidoreductase subunit B-like Fe-S oxidoreductase
MQLKVVSHSATSLRHNQLIPVDVFVGGVRTGCNAECQAIAARLQHWLFAKQPNDIALGV